MDDKDREALEDALGTMADIEKRLQVKIKHGRDAIPCNSDVVVTRFINSWLGIEKPIDKLGLLSICSSCLADAAELLVAATGEVFDLRSAGSIAAAMARETSDDDT